MPKTGDIVWGTLERVPANPAEVSLRLQTPRLYTTEQIRRCSDRLNAVMVCRYAYTRTPVDFPDEGVCRFDFATVRSRDLYRNLYGCREAFVFAVTLGIGVDRLLYRLRLTSQAEEFITDALASAAAETLCERTNEALRSEALRGETALRPRFSPGYGDVELSVQKPLLQRIQAEKTLGIALNGAYLMTPTKSITAIAGIEMADGSARSEATSEKFC